MLHVLDGDATRAAFTAARLQGAMVVWREMLSVGPTPRALADEAAWEERAAHLEREEDVPADALLADVRAARDAARAAAEAGDEVVLWFDEDLWCRVHAAYFAALLPDARVTNAVGSHFDRGDLRGLLARRAPLDPALAQVWPALAGEDPRAMLPLVERFPWLRLRLARFPSPRDGLDLVERRALEALRRGPLSFADLSRAVATGELSATSYGLTDREVARIVRDLASGSRALVRLDESMPARATASLTAEGRDVLAGRADRADLVPIDRWVGGARAAAWRWDGTTLLRA